MRKHYVLIDYENVCPDLMAALEREHFYVLVFVGASQTKVTFDVASVLQKLGSRAEYIKITGNGSNSLDFHIAFYLGQIVAQEPEACFHIISKDTGFDPLLQHLKSKQMLVSRSPSIAGIPCVKRTVLKPVSEKAAAVLDNLKQRGASKPKTVKSLGSTINALFQKALPEPEVAAIIQEIQQHGAIVITATHVSYSQ